MGTKVVVKLVTTKKSGCQIQKKTTMVFFILV